MLIKKNSLISGKINSYLLENHPALKWHNLEPSLYSFFSIENYLKTQNWDFKYVDVQQGTGSSANFISMDLNQPIPSDLYCSFDLLIDSGTAEHCFNVGKVFENYFHLLKPGGILLQYMPFHSPNHGFWSINPTAIYDLASCNPIKLLTCELQSFDNYRHYFDANPNILPFSKTGKFSINIDSLKGICLMFFAYKKVSKSIFRFPIQAKYRSQMNGQ